MVVPVVVTSSMSRMLLPATLFPAARAKAPSRLAFLCACDKPDLGRRVLFFLQQHPGPEGDPQAAGQHAAHGPRPAGSRAGASRSAGTGTTASKTPGSLLDGLQAELGQQMLQRLHLPVFVQDDDLAQGLFIGGIGNMAEKGGGCQQAGTAGIVARGHEFAADPALVLGRRLDFLPAVPADHLFLAPDQVQPAVAAARAVKARAHELQEPAAAPGERVSKEHSPA